MAFKISSRCPYLKSITSILLILFGLSKPCIWKGIYFDSNICKLLEVDFQNNCVHILLHIQTLRTLVHRIISLNDSAFGLHKRQRIYKEYFKGGWIACVDKYPIVISGYGILMALAITREPIWHSLRNESWSTYV